MRMRVRKGYTFWKNMGEDKKRQSCGEGEILELTEEEVAEQDHKLEIVTDSKPTPPPERIRPRGRPRLSVTRESRPERRTIREMRPPVDKGD